MRRRTGSYVARGAVLLAALALAAQHDAAASGGKPGPRPAGAKDGGEPDLPSGCSPLADGHSRPVAFVDGFQAGLEVAAAIAVAGAVIAVATMRSHSERRPDEVPVEEPAFQEAA